MTHSTVTALLPATAPVDADFGGLQGNTAASPLTADMTSSQLTIPVTELANYPDSGTVWVGTERIRYSSRSASSGAGNLVVTTGDRGFDGSTAQAHLQGELAVLAIGAYFFNRVIKEVEAIGGLLTGASAFLHGITIKPASAETALTLDVLDQVGATGVKLIDFQAGGVSKGYVAWDATNAELDFVNMSPTIGANSNLILENDRALKLGDPTMGTLKYNSGTGLVSYSGVDIDFGGAALRSTDPKGSSSIVVYTSAGQVYARTAAGVPITSGTDAGAVISAAIATLANGGQVLVRSGSYTLQTGIVMNKNNVWLRGEDRNSVTLQLRAGVGSFTLIQMSGTGLTVSDLTVDGNKSNITTPGANNNLIDNRTGVVSFVRVERCNVQHNASQGGIAFGELYDVGDLVIADNFVTDCQPNIYVGGQGTNKNRIWIQRNKSTLSWLQHNLFVDWGCNDVWVTDNESIDPYEDHLEVGGGSNVHVARNTFLTPTTTSINTGIYVRSFRGALDRIHIEDNFVDMGSVTSTGRDAIFVQQDTAGPAFGPITNITIRGNTVKNFTRNGVRIQTSNGPLSVQANKCSTTKTIDVDGGGIYVVDSRDGIVHGNYVKGVSGQANAFRGIQIRNSTTEGVYNISTSDNEIDTADDGVRYVRCDRDVVSGNRVLNCTNGIISVVNDYLTVAHNSISGCTTPITLAGSNNILRSNQGATQADIFPTGLTPLTDNSVPSGTASLRWQAASALAFNAYGAAGDANPKYAHTTTGFLGGAGGGSATDVTLARQAASVWEVTGSLAGSVRLGLLAAGNAAVAVRAASTDTNPSYRMSVTGGFEFGAGGASAPDASLVWGSAGQINAASGTSLNLVSGSLKFAGTTLLNASGDFARTFLPATDDNLDQGNASRRWHTIYARQYRVLSASGDAQPLVQVDDLGIHMGPGGATTTDLRLKRITTSVLSVFDDSSTFAGDARVGLLANAQPVFETRLALTDTNPTSRLSAAGISTGAGGLNALDANLQRNASSDWIITGTLAGDVRIGLTGAATPRLSLRLATTDANHAAALQKDRVEWGAGGASSVDVDVRRSGANTIQVTASSGTTFTGDVTLTSDVTLHRTGANAATLSSSLSPATDNTYDMGTSALRWRSIYATPSIHVLAAASDANDVTTIGNARIIFGAGGATAVDVILKREQAQTLSVRTGDDTGYGAIRATFFTASTGFVALTGTSPVIQARDTTDTLTTVATLTRAASPTLDLALARLTGALNANSQNITTLGSLQWNADSTLARQASSTLELTGSNAGSVRFGMSGAATPFIALRAAAADANALASLTTTGLSIGAGGASAVDVTLLRTGAAAATFTGDLNLANSLLIGGTTLFENDRDVAVTLLPNATTTLDFGSSSRFWRVGFVGAMNVGVASKSANYTVTTTDALECILVTTGAGGVTITLPAATGSGRRLMVKKVDSGVGALTVSRNATPGTDTIDGAASVSSTTQYASYILVDGASGAWSVF